MSSYIGNKPFGKSGIVGGGFISVDSEGNFLVDQGTANDATSHYLLTIRAAADDTIFNMAQSNDGDSGHSINQVTVGRLIFKRRADGSSTEVFMLHENGDTYTNDGTVASLSDSRVKKDIEDLPDGLSVVNQLRPITFKYNGKAGMANDDDVTRYGLIADEVQLVAPQYVKETTEIVDDVEVDDFKSLSTIRMIPMLINAIQELSAKVTALENA